MTAYTTTPQRFFELFPTFLWEEFSIADYFRPDWMVWLSSEEIE